MASRSPRIIARRRKVAPLTLLIVSITLAINSRAQTSQKHTHALSDRIDAVVRAVMKKGNVPGCSLVILKRGQVVKIAAYGYENLETESPARVDTAYQTGSVGKMFTAAAILRLVEQGRLHLDDSVAAFIPDAPGAWKSIQIRHLLNHTSGLIDYEALEIDDAQDYTLLQVIGKAAAPPLEFPVGAAFSYSNTDYVILGAILEKITGKAYRTVMEELIFQPLGMSETSIIDLTVLTPHRANGYTHSGKTLLNGLNSSPSLTALPDGGMITTVRDMAKWDQAMNLGRLLTQAHWNAMMSPTKLDTGRIVNYGYGWFTPVVQDRRVVEHGGNTTAFNAEIYRDLSVGVTVIVMMNDASSSATALAHRIIRETLPETKPVNGKALAPDETLSTRTRRFMDSWFAGIFDEGLASADFRFAMKTARNKARLKKASQAGRIQSWTYVESIADGADVNHIFELRMELRSYRATLTLLPDGTIGGLNLERED